MAGHQGRTSRSPLAVAATIVLVFLAGGVAGGFVGRATDRPSAAPSSGGQAGRGTSSSTTSGSSTSTTRVVAPLSVASLTPDNGAVGVAGNTPITISLSAALSPSSPLPTIQPTTPGSWRTIGDSFIFTPSTDFLPLSSVTVIVPGGASGVVGVGGGHLGQSMTETFQVANGSLIRLQQLLSLLAYSPLKWVAAGTPLSASDSQAQIAALYKPPGGNFAWRVRSWPSRLLAMWEPGVDNVFTRGLVMSFQADHNLTPNGAIVASLWPALLSALASADLNAGGYNYALANKAVPESLTVYHNGVPVVQTPANTGIDESPTPDGTFPVYERLRQQVMRGTNPDGASYADLVQYIAYFDGNDAVHYMDRADYGIPQSLGCVELPLASAARVWPYLAYGTLVTIIN